MSETDARMLAAAAQFAQAAADTASKLKPGTYEAVKALALTSIALRMSAEPPAS